ncbi:MAG: flavodoxin [Bacteroidales bacterium]|nr:flavodoxin [Bacteroidales bacterium]
MKKTAIIYSFNTKKTSKIAAQIQEAFNNDSIAMVNAEEIAEELFLSFDRIIMGVATWFDGELPNFWDEFLPALEEMDLTGKKFALFGLGDQKGYPENFLDGVGIMGEILESQGATLVGFTSTEGYEFESSRALRNDQFMGLAIDYENQGSMIEQRVANWVDQLKIEFA